MASSGRLWGLLIEHVDSVEHPLENAMDQRCQLTDLHITGHWYHWSLVQSMSLKVARKVTCSYMTAASLHVFDLG